MKKNKIFFIEYERVGYDEVGQTIVIAPNKEKAKIVGHEGNNIKKIVEIGETELPEGIVLDNIYYG